MDQDTQSQLDRAKELLSELKEACTADLLSKNVSGKTRNLSQEVLQKIKHLLDQSFYKFFEKYYSTKLSEGDNKKARVYFPMVFKQNDLDSTLGRAMMSDLKFSYPNTYAFLDSVQPYNNDYLWLGQLAKYASEKHVRLTPQTLKFENETKLGNIMHVGRGAIVSMHSCLVNGIPVDSENVNETPLENFDPRLNVQRVTWVSFLFEGSNVNVVDLCNKSVSEGEKIIIKLLDFV